MYWDKSTTFTIILGSPSKISPLGFEAVEAMRKTTNLIQRSVHSDRDPDPGDDFIALFTPKLETGDLMKWLESNQGRNPALDYFRAQPPISRWGFIRTPSLLDRPYIFQRWCIQDMSPQEKMVEAECVQLPRRRNFLQEATLSKGLLVHSESSKPKAAASPQAQRFPAQDATVDSLAFDQARFGLFIPSILQHVEVYLVAQKLCTTVLKAVLFSNVGLVIGAVSCPSANWITNYQRLESIGDSVLKFIVSRQLFVDHPSWHEGYLTQARINVISNNALASAAIATGLDAFIMTEQGRAGSKSCPRISDMASGP
jgi:hypothetical protein